MQIQSQRVIKQAVNDIWSQFKNELKIKQLMKFLPQYNKNYVSKMSNAGTGTAYLQHPPVRNIFAFDQMNEDQSPYQIPIDELANFQVKSITGQIKGPIIKDKSEEKQSKQTTRYKKSSFTNRSTNKNSKIRQKQQDQQLTKKYFVLPQNTKNQLYQLPAQVPSQEEIDLQFQLRAMQKKLYFMRQSKKQQQLLEQQRIKALKRRKSPELPKTDFTYQTNGNFLKRKPFKSDSLLVEQMKVSQSFDAKPKQKKSLQQLLQNQDEAHRGRSQIGSRFKRTTLFNNSNKRQVSHLPFIKMSDNTKLKQDNRNTQGFRTQRVSLKSFSESIEEKTFKHHSQIQKQKRQRQLIAKLQAKRAEKMKQQVDKNPEQPDDDGYNNLIRRRQSYLLNRYLKKVKQQNTQEVRKSLNFGRVSNPKNSAIQAYYKHDFNGERRFYQSQVISKVLDNSQAFK